MAVKIRSVCIIGGSGGNAPTKVKLFVNRDDVEFDTAADLPGEQTMELHENPDGAIDYPTR